MDYPALQNQLQHYVKSCFTSKENPALVYHNLDHTEYIVHAATRIVTHYQLDSPDFFIVIAAAWFHDLGYFEEAADHENKGAEHAEAYLKTKGLNDDIISSVKSCILATAMPQKPANLLEQIVCDADLFHLGTDSFNERNKLLRKEFENIHHTKVKKEEWRLDTIKFLENHRYHTDYCRLLLNEKKQENLENLLQKEERWKKEHPIPQQSSPPELPKEGDAATAESKKKKSERPDRGIETMFRISAGNHQRLSDMADSKAQIMISVNSIIVSVLLSVLLRKLEDNPHLILPCILLLTVNLVTIVFSILATRPNIPPGTFTQSEVDEKKVNLLFFGNFYRMSSQDYTAGMLKMMDDRDFLYGSLINDLYSQGVVLGRKYHLLRVAYDVFMFGMIISVLAFVIASLVFAS
jgi:predicted metal-dependent HD superfamily phosphohydrolase